MMFPFGLVINEGILGVMIPIIALIIPIVAILTKHQMKMAALIHGKTIDENNNVVSSNANDSQLSQEVRQLRELMHQQTLALDNLRDELRTSNSVQDRINQNS